jgi:predicted Zn-dependent peptidase
MEHTVTEHKLEGGAKLLTVQIPNTITYYWASNFRAGFRFVPEHKYELPHLAEHLAFAGTTSYPDALKFKSQIEQDGTYYNAHTGLNLVWYDFVGSRDELERVIPLNMSQIYEPLYEPHRIQQEQDVITQELGRYKEDDNWRLGYKLLHDMVPEFNPDIDARITNIQKISRDDILAYHQQYYGAANTSFVLAGDFSGKRVEGVIAELNRHLKQRPAGEIQPIVAPKLAGYGGKVHAYTPYRENQSVFVLRFVLPGRDDDSAPALRIMSTILTGGLSSRLQRKAREAGLTYGISAGFSTTEDMTIFSVSSQANLEKLPALVELAATELAAIGAGEFGDDELARAQGFIAGGIRRSYQTPASLAEWYDTDFVYGRPLESPEQWIARVRAVDRAAIDAAYKKYMRHGNSVLGMVGKDLDKQTDEYAAIVGRYFS